jgi:hypothetical protein
MTTCTIHVKKNAGANPNFRNSASELFAAVVPGIQEVVLDFAGVEFISRGFADELHKERIKWQEEKHARVVLENVNEEIARMLAAVARTQGVAERSMVDLPVIRVNSVKELEDLLLGS